MLLIDNTQYTAYMKCPAYWFEKYVRNYQKPVEGPRSDALAIGVHFHSALENIYSGLGIRPSPEVIEEYPLTKEAELEVATMIAHYKAYYPKGPLEFPWVGLEDTIMTPPIAKFWGEFRIAAKLDGYFEVPEEKEFNFNDGLGHRVTIPPGIWGFETKTKGPKLDRGLYMKEWQAAMQASFQLIALKEQLPIDKQRLVRGILVNVIERPVVYEPRKSCESCKQLQFIYTYQVKDTQHICSLCGHANTFKSIPRPRVDPPFFWRFIVERSDQRLRIDRDSINKVALNMMYLTEQSEKLAEMGEPTINLAEKNRSNCVSTFMKSTCEFFEPHNAHVPQEANEAFGFKIFNPTKYLEPKKEE